MNEMNVNDKLNDDDADAPLPVVVPDEGDDIGAESGGRAPIDLDSAYDVEELNKIFGATMAAGGGNGAPVEAQAVEPVDMAAIHAEREAELLALIEKEKNTTLRAIADLHNYRKRAEEEKKRIIASANERLIKDLLPLVDDFDRSLVAAKQTQSYEMLVDGVEAVVRKIADTLAKEGVQPIPSVGEQFNPDYHDAVMVEEGSDHPDESIVEEFRRGYTMNDRVIRPALVKVAKA